MNKANKWDCLVSHKCAVHTHEFIRLISQIFDLHAVALKVDPFEPGEDVLAAIKAFAFQSLLFLSTPESAASHYCQAELKAARTHGVPIFTIRLAGDVPQELRLRIYVDAREASQGQLTEPLDRLAAVVKDRSCILALLEQLRVGRAAETQRDAARALRDRHDTLALGEFLPYLATAYSHTLDPLARFDLALAVGATRHAEARVILEKWISATDHPYPQEGIVRGIELLSLVPKLGDKE
jgi:hypothetical protein